MFYLHFTDGETGSVRVWYLAQCHTASQWQSWGPNLGLSGVRIPCTLFYVPESVGLQADQSVASSLFLLGKGIIFLKMTYLIIRMD